MYNPDAAGKAQEIMDEIAGISLEPYRKRVGLAAALRELESTQAYKELDAFVAQEAGALGLTLAEIDTEPTYLL